MRGTARSLVLVAAMSAVLAACQRNAEIEPPPGPAGVPAKAIWAGGVDGGDFILLSPAARHVLGEDL